MINLDQFIHALQEQLTPSQYATIGEIGESPYESKLTWIMINLPTQPGVMVPFNIEPNECKPNKIVYIDRSRMVRRFIDQLIEYNGELILGSLPNNPDDDYSWGFMVGDTAIMIQWV